MNALIGPSLLACDMSNLASESIRVLEAGADFLHIDVMDGHFVPNLTLGAPIISCLRKNVPHAVFDVHLMVTHPERWVEDMAAAGSTIFTFHLEVELDEAAKKLLIRKIKEHGMRAGISIKPGTPVEACLPFLDDVDLVLIMTVEPGFGGQKFMANMMQKVEYLRALKPELDIEVDGGLGPDTIDIAAIAGANMIVAGSSVFKSDPIVVIPQLRSSVAQAIANRTRK